MVFKKTGDGYILRLERGEELGKALIDFCEAQKITAGWLSGLGGVVNAQVGYYNLKRKKYVFRHVKNVCELASLTGNIATVGGHAALHMHGVVTDTRNKAYGGHLRSAEVGGTLEIYLSILPGKLTRELDPDIGLPLLKL